jgi:hypothetical protein
MSSASDARTIETSCTYTVVTAREFNRPTLGSYT